MRGRTIARWIVIAKRLSVLRRSASMLIAPLPDPEHGHV
jgi:hypothetical protein